MKLHIKISIQVVLLILCFTSVYGQVVIHGIVHDSINNKELSYVNIGIRHKNIGTVSLRDGSFSLAIPRENKADTLTFSMVGYYDYKLSITNFSNDVNIKLKPKTEQLDEVIIKSPLLVEKKFGEPNYHALVQFTDGSTNQKDIFEIGQLIHLDTSLSKITAVSLYISSSRPDSGTFRINFYKYDGRHPATRIYDKNITQTQAITKGWLTFDLKRDNIYIKGDFVAAIEFIPNSPVNKPINYNIKVVGSTKSFYRASSQGDWRLPPHHYVLYVTALVEKGAK
jgi:CarboxypepD_reg-like domain